MNRVWYKMGCGSTFAGCFPRCHKGRQLLVGVGVNAFGREVLPETGNCRKIQYDWSMSVQRRPISSQGHRKLQENLDRMIRIERPAVIKEIEVALGHGDLTENAEYTYAKEKQALIETRIRDIQERLSTCEVIDLENRPPTDKIVFGCTVTIEDIDSGSQRVLRLLGEDEVDIANGVISVTSPLGRSLIGKEEGDVAEVKTPDGLREYEILEIA